MVPRVNCLDCPEQEVNLTAGEPAFGSARGSYKFWLPNIDYDVDLASNLKLRAGYATTLVARTSACWLAASPSATTLTLAAVTATRAADLKPLLSKNLDASLEYYYAKSSYVAAGLFYKKVTNFIGNTVVVRTFRASTAREPVLTRSKARAACGANASRCASWQLDLPHQPEGPAGRDRWHHEDASGEISGRIESPARRSRSTNFNISTPTNIRVTTSGVWS